jgi:hypothetical protein
MFLIFWDKLFGTFQREMEDGSYSPIKYGLTKNIEHPNAASIVFHEWSQIVKDIFQPSITISQRLKYLFGPPGYSHDGTRKTSVEMRLEEYSAAQNESIVG